MRKKLLISIICNLFLISFNSCTSSSKDEYSGYIFLNKEPLKKTKISDLRNVDHYTFTNDTGYFKLEKLYYSIDDIVISQPNGDVDTINLIRKNGADALLYSLFLRKGVLDTLYLDRERFFKEQSSGK